MSRRAQPTVVAGRLVYIAWPRRSGSQLHQANFKQVQFPRSTWCHGSSCRLGLAVFQRHHFSLGAHQEQ